MLVDTRTFLHWPDAQHLIKAVVQPHRRVLVILSPVAHGQSPVLNEGLAMLLGMRLCVELSGCDNFPFLKAFHAFKL